MPKFAEVVPAIPLAKSGPESYTYRIPDSSSAPRFSRVKIPFGRQKIIGVILRSHSNTVPYPTKELASLSPEQLTPNQVALARWISRTMRGGFGYTLRLFFPPILGRRTLAKISEETRELPQGVELSPEQAEQAESFLEQVKKKPGAILQSNNQKRFSQIACLAKTVASRGDQSLVAMPEKWLLEQSEQVFTRYFKKTVAFVHGGISPQEQYRIWRGVQDGRIKLVVGTQSALFLPYKKLGLIVMDQEYYPTHKLWDAFPRLDNHYGVRSLGNIHGASIVYTGSIPSLWLYKEIDEKNINLLAEESLMLKPTIINTTFADRREKKLLPRAGWEHLRLWAKQKQIIFILYNRRGLWSSLVCSACQKTVRCPECDVSLVVHRKGRKQELNCHHCGYTDTMPDKCPSCEKEKLRTIGLGSERIREIIAEELPRASVYDISLDNVSQWSPEEIKNLRKQKKAVILIGTSVAFRLLARTGVDRAMLLFPERAMLYPDFRSEERTIYTLVRLKELLPANRSVAIVTRYNRLIMEKLLPGLQAYTAILRERKRLAYPPFQDLIRLTVSSKDEATARRVAGAVRRHIEPKLNPGMKLRGPFQSFIKNRRGRVEAHLLLSGNAEKLPEVYAGIPVSSADLNPERIL